MILFKKALYTEINISKMRKDATPCIKTTGEMSCQLLCSVLFGFFALGGRYSLLTIPSSPETMGALSAVVYLLIIIVFIPFLFYRDIVAATSGGGNRDVVIELEQINTGRLLHRFPHSKVFQIPKIPISLHVENLQ